MEPTIGIEPITYRLQGDCSTSWAKSAQNKTRLVCYFFFAVNKRATLAFFLAAVFFFKTPTLAHLSTYLYILLRSSCVTVSPLVTFLRNFLIAIFILSLNSVFLLLSTIDLFIAFLADLMIGICVYWVS